jgi:hypothetical protein
MMEAGFNVQAAEIARIGHPRATARDASDKQRSIWQYLE